MKPLRSSAIVVLALLCGSDAGARSWWNWGGYGHHYHHRYYRHHRHYGRHHYYHYAYRRDIRSPTAEAKPNPDRENLLNMRRRLNAAGRIIQEGPQARP